jgi:Plasmid encoded RepA protein
MDDIKPLSRVDRRLIYKGADIIENQSEDITYQHTVLCQTSLPYRDPGDIRRWERQQGQIHLLVNAGEAFKPEENRFVELGLPFGPKPRLILMHLNSQAIKAQSPLINVEDSMTAFARQVLGYSPNGKEMKLMKGQLGRLAAATIRVALNEENNPIQVDTKIVTAFNLWFPKDEKQHVLWSSTVRLSEDYFKSLSKHAVPLDERAVSALSHSAMALDIYAWLAQRLYRIDKPQFITWKALKEQFGWNHRRMNNFRAVFISALEQVHSQYRVGRFNIDGGGMTLFSSPPPVRKLFAIKK